MELVIDALQRFVKARFVLMKDESDENGIPNFYPKLIKPTLFEKSAQLKKRENKANI